MTNRLHWLTRILTAQYRKSPSCFIVGAQKAGTTSLYHYLAQHPDIKKGYTKEVHFFDGGLDPTIDAFKKGKNWYKAHFPLSLNSRSGQYCIDATPMYLFNPSCAEKIFNFNPQSKIIILLRDPVERAISHYFHSKRHGFEPLCIEDAINEEKHRLRAITNYKDLSYRVHSYCARGLYLEQIMRYQRFFKDSQILILDSQDLFLTPENTLNTVFKFLGINQKYMCTDLKSKNIASNKEKVSPKVVSQLSSFFEQPNLKLFAHLQQNFSWQ